MLEADPAAWTVGWPSTNAGRALVAYLAFKTYGYRGKELADAMGYRSTTSTAVAAERIEGSTELRRAWRRLVREVRGFEKEVG